MFGTAPYKPPLSSPALTIATKSGEKTCGKAARAAWKVSPRIIAALSASMTFCTDGFLDWRRSTPSARESGSPAFIIAERFRANAIRSSATKPPPIRMFTREKNEGVSSPLPNPFFSCRVMPLFSISKEKIDFLSLVVTNNCLLSTFYFLLSTFYFLLSTFYFLLSTYYFPLSTFHFLLSTFYFPLSTFYFP